MERGLPHGRAQSGPVTKLTPRTARKFILDSTALMAPPHVPEVLLHLADEAHDLWLRTEEELAEIGLPPPFWAFAWAGGQGLARYVLDNPGTVRGKRVLDFASGSGLVAIAAMKAGASQVIAADIDPFCETAIAINLDANGVEAQFRGTDCVGTDDGWDVVLAGDVFYDKAFSDRLLPWFGSLRERGAEILVGDPGRAYLPKTGLGSLAVYQVPVTRVLEDAEVKRTTVWRLA
ncbi:methyltransferase [Mesorhizobium sp. ESP-6-4]|uniref:class I SAM-dependent methyltransferase n=1 Tax=unclassified Mesorhizobium TaxID=325217 RepID=UPI001CC979AD|nr:MULTISPECIES: methyltransferase [unclassified Mesorhizobium]MBZ9658876.1 methyltransferase [Mesorhizobium sp. ESP-6-4]MBZ9844833.1 methyltransferase [Mesorhizobium sp. CA5]